MLKKAILEFSNGVKEAHLLYSKNLIIYRQATNILHKSEASEFSDFISGGQDIAESIKGNTPNIIPNFYYDLEN